MKLFFMFFGLTINNIPDLSIKQPIRSHLIEAHELSGGVLFALIERFEADICGRFGCVGERTRDGVQIMSSNGNQRPFPDERRAQRQNMRMCSETSPDQTVSMCVSTGLQTFWCSFSCSSMKLS